MSAKMSDAAAACRGGGGGAAATAAWPALAAELATTHGLSAVGDAETACDAFVRDALKRFPLSAATVRAGGRPTAVLYTPHADALREAFASVAASFPFDVDVHSHGRGE